MRRVHVVDPAAYTPAYNHALCAALARAGAQVELITSRFVYASVPRPDGYQTRELFYRHAPSRPGSRWRFAVKLAGHVPAMLRYRRAANAADVVHFQWLDVEPLDVHLLPDRPLVLTAHDLLPREPRVGQVRAQRRLYEAVDAVIVHSDHGRRRLIDATGIDASKLHVVPHGAFEHLARQSDERPLPDELARTRVPVVLFFGLLRGYKGLEVLLEAWRGVEGAELWIVGRARLDLSQLRAAAPPGVRFVTRYISDAELPAFFRRADIVVLPYTDAERFDQSGVLSTALAFGRPTVLSDVGGFAEVAATGAAELVPPADAAALRNALSQLVADPARRTQLSRAARAAAAGPYSWDLAAHRTLEVYDAAIALRAARDQ